MKKLALLMISVCLMACNNERKSIESSDSTSLTNNFNISFKYDSVKVYSKYTITNENSSDTTKAVLSYPVFGDIKIDQFLEQKMLAFGNEGEHYNTYEDFCNSFIKNYDTFTKENKDYAQTWFMDGKIEVVAQEPKYISALITFVSYEGGAHPNSVFSYVNYNTSTHKEITLDSLIIPGSMPKLTAIAEQIFRKNEKISPTESLKDKYFFENDKFSLNQNFTITKKGLKFLYNPYEIKAYVYGTTELLIPFAELKGIAKPNSLLNPVN